MVGNITDTNADPFPNKVREAAFQDNIGSLLKLQNPFEASINTINIQIPNNISPCPLEYILALANRHPLLLQSLLGNRFSDSSALAAAAQLGIDPWRSTRGAGEVDDLEEDHEDEEELGWSRAVTSWDDTKGEVPGRKCWAGPY